MGAVSSMRVVCSSAEVLDQRPLPEPAHFLTHVKILARISTKLLLDETRNQSLLGQVEHFRENGGVGGTVSLNIKSPTVLL